MAKRGDEVSTFLYNFLHVNAAPQNYCTVALSGLCFLYCHLVVKWSVFMGKVKLFLQYCTVYTRCRRSMENTGI